jgi:hypothetical protein
VTPLTARGRSLRTLSGALLACSSIVLVLGSFTPAAAQDDVDPDPTVPSATETETASETPAMLIRGDGREGSESTTTTIPMEPIAADSEGPSDESLIRLIIAGLVLVALLVAVLTWRYWVATRPELLPVADAEPERQVDEAEPVPSESAEAGDDQTSGDSAPEETGTTLPGDEPRSRQTIAENSTNPPAQSNAGTP